jgi:hypothetical protein
MSRDILEKIIINGFDNNEWTRFLRGKNEICWKPKTADFTNYNTVDFTGGEKIGEYNFEEGKKLTIFSIFF